MKRLLLIFIVGVMAAWSNPLARDMMLGDYGRVLSTPEYGLLEDALRTSYRAAKEGYAEAVAGEITVTTVSTAVDDGSGPREVEQAPATVVVPAPTDDRLVVGGCSMTAEQTDEILREYSSPALDEPGISEHILAECARTGIDNAVVIAQFILESGAGSNPQWAGNLGNGEYSKNPGNIIVTSSARQIGAAGRFGIYPTWAAGFSDKYDLLSCYVDPSQAFCPGLWTGAPLDEPTVTAAIYRWAPPSDNNDSAGYAKFVLDFAGKYRILNAGTSVHIEGDNHHEEIESVEDISSALETYQELVDKLPSLPATEAAASIPAVGRQAEPWPGAIDGVNHSYGYHAGAYDWVAPLGTPVYAPVTGTFKGQGEYHDTLRYGAYMMFDDGCGLEIYLGHLDMANVNPAGWQPGQQVAAGQQIGQLGPFPSSPHSHIQLRRNGMLVPASSWWSEWDSRGSC